MPEKGWRAITVREETYFHISKYMDENKDLLSQEGIETPNDLIEWFISKQPKPRFEHFNVCDDHVTIIDRAIQPDELLNVYIRDKKLYCESCQTDNCVHVGYAWTIPKVREKLNPLLMAPVILVRA